MYLVSFLTSLYCHGSPDNQDRGFLSPCFLTKFSFYLEKRIPITIHRECLKKILFSVYYYLLLFTLYLVDTKSVLTTKCLYLMVSL